MILKIILITLLLLYGCSDKGDIKTEELKSNKPEISQKKSPQSASDQNSPPRIVSSKLLPTNPKKGDIISIEVSTEDMDGDEVSLEYEWILNDTVLPAVKGDSLRTDLKRGDRIIVRITPYDGQDRGTTITNWVSVTNSPPDINTELSDVLLRGTKCQAKVIASDPDGDKITYSLKKSPEGMTIDSASGIITWDYSEEPVQHEFTVIAKDTEGAETDLKLSIEGCFPESEG